LAIFRERTLPLLAHYRAQGAAIEEVPVGVAATPEMIGRWLEERTAWKPSLQLP
jgi:hypothetical protein